jgi:mono/diheme cytochrome c family protein
MGRHFTLILLAGSCLLFPSGAWAEERKPEPTPAAQIEFFEKYVRPVLVTKCFQCHAAEKQKGGLRLDSQAAMLSGGDSGPAMQPGKPDDSRIIKAIRYDGTIQMPPTKKLTDEQIHALTAWVKMGAPWPPANTATRPPEPAKEFRITKEDRAFWSFQLIKNPPLPAVKNAAWPQASLDYFILAPLEAKGLQPMAPADHRALIRRMYFDLIGLPPTPSEVDEFCQCASHNPQSAIAKLVDRLLANPHYGERWARHWLDIARYGEDQAHSFQPKLYPHGFRYRDWLIKAFNDDLPYDRFLTEQIAGDLLDGPGQEERLAALGYFALGPVYYGKAIADELDDRVDTLCRGMLGLTVACARCHDHKFDPIPTRDYYSLAGIFASTQFKEYPLADPATSAAFDRANAAIKAKNDAITAFLQTESKRMSEAMTQEIGRYLVAAWKVHNQRKINSAVTVAEVAKKEKLRDFVLDRWVGYLFLKDADERPYLAEWRKLLASQEAAKDLSTDASAIADVTKVAEEFQAYVVSARTVAGPWPDSDTRLSLYQELTSNRGVLSIPRDQLEKLLPAAAQKKLASDRAEVERLKKALPQVPVVHSLAEGPSPANMKVYIRGNSATPGDEAPRRFLAVLSGDDRKTFTHGSGRLELAQAIASKDNPLTARVIVNRIWAQHFGKGIVGTPSNFGSLGERPTHPELLDHLASRFMANGWSIKALHRDILLSATYQLASRHDAANHMIDPANKLYWRMDRRRLEVEPWRDALLAVAGNLDSTIGGPSADLASPDHRRRTLYAAISRHNLDGLLRLFDFPDPNLTSDKRQVTTVPLQQLFVLNSEFMVRQAKALAVRLKTTQDEDDAARIRRSFLLVYGRPARDIEVQLGLEFLKAAPAGESRAKTLTPWEQYAQVLLSANEFMFVD